MLGLKKYNRKLFSQIIILQESKKKRTPYQKHIPKCCMQKRKRRNLNLIYKVEMIFSLLFVRKVQSKSQTQLIINQTKTKNLTISLKINNKQAHSHLFNLKKQAHFNMSDQNLKENRVRLVYIQQEKYLDHLLE